jgi:hypothetical protein
MTVASRRLTVIKICERTESLMMQWMKRVGIALTIALFAVQLVPVVRSNPTAHSFPEAPAEVQALMRRSCGDCHSNETNWPWYAHVAPVSFLIARDVNEGRKKLNASVWDRYDDALRARKKREIAKQIEKGAMPPWYYVPLHPEAKLSVQERDLIIKWANKS